MATSNDLPDTLSRSDSESLDFRVLFERECSYVVASLRRLGVQERDLEDVAHEVFVAIHRQLDKYDPARPLRPWIFAFAYRFASDYRRLARHRRERIEDTVGEEVDEAEGPEARIDAARARALVIQALDALDLDKRAVMVMHEIDGVPIPEVATALGIPLNTAYSRLRLAREQFAQAARRLQARGQSDAQARRLRGGR
ncbi:MAG: sigma-70 family RNA polymerase sigma factor [Myxococcales bacterium]|nr:sigma-70 family RNA polymerase sigma factor [Myxococcales bacterium]